MVTRIRSILGRIARSYVLFVVIGLVVGLVLAPVAFTAASGSGDVVAVVPLEGAIDGNSAAAVSSQLERARESSRVKAVVVVSNSGGGTASGSETLYLQSKRLADGEKPFVASVDAAAASGAYYTIAPADVIVAKPASIVGSVGVRAPVPQELEPNDIEGTTGPDKVTGYSDREFFYVLESLRVAFVNAVVDGRGDRLSLSADEVSQAQIYSGAQAVEVGLADRIGDRQEAVRIAAERAGLESYDVEVFRASGPTRFVAQTNYLASTAPEKEMVPMSRYTESSGGLPTFLMMPGSYVESTDRRFVAADDLGSGPADDVDGRATATANATAADPPDPALAPTNVEARTRGDR
jgi:protease-4